VRIPRIAIWQDGPHTGSSAVALAWLYFGSRCVHSFIHLGSNDVTHRLIAFVVSGLILAGMWILLLLSVASSGT